MSSLFRKCGNDKTGNLRRCKSGWFGAFHHYLNRPSQNTTFIRHLGLAKKKVEVKMVKLDAFHI